MLTAMTVTTSPAVRDQELVSFGLVESASVNSITDFTQSKSNERQANTSQGKEDFINIFICHLIFYAVFCLSLVLHILLDLGLGQFIKNNLAQLIAFGKKIVFDKSLAFA